MKSAKRDPALRRLFLGHQKVLLEALSADREATGHPSLKGDATEAHWRGMLEHHLPHRYHVSSGIVVDSDEGESDQIDIVIHDAHYCPRFREHDGVSFVPAESVYAVLEAKQELNATYLRAAAAKAESVRTLKRTSGPILERGREMPARDLPPILAGIVSLTASWSDGLGQSFKEQLAVHKGLYALDLGCALKVGSFEVPERGGPADVATLPADTALESFFLTLVRRLQRLATVPAIEWQRYEQAL